MIVQGDDESVPYKQIEQLCKLFCVPFNVYDTASCLDQVIAQLQFDSVRNDALEKAAREAEHWDTIDPKNGRKDGAYIAAAIRGMKK